MKNNKTKTENSSPLGAGGEKSPIFGTWRNVYTLVAGTLFFLIVLFYVFTLYFA
jgi:hypothetical protein